MSDPLSFRLSLGHLLPLLSCLGQADSDGLLATLDRAALAALSTRKRALLSLAHRALDAFRGTLRIFPRHTCFL
jgi:hypothetical protein